ncbi:unnamed protein product [Diabrotica balteata]|uniref:Uncharacterized protein n=1 Tax=Diabrotica balteata TaxID=107213 RepID=A0A9N9SNW3_DIABA|nr:unnamed protein product [Diabrotica balteata]
MPDSPVRTNADTHFSVTSPRDLIPLPKVKAGTKRAVKKRGKTAVLTASPYKVELEESLKKMQAIKEAKEKKIKQRLMFKNDENKPREIETQRKRKENKKKQVKTKAKKQKISETESEDSAEEEDTACLYCHDYYSKSNEGWCSCSI